MTEKKARQKSKSPGPDPETLKAEGVTWEEAMAHALQKPKPEQGWPEAEKKAKKKGESQSD